MVHIISKSDAPRREDTLARRIIAENRGTIEGIADRLTGGKWKELRQLPPRPPAEAAISSRGYPARPSDEPEPYVRISPNRRVVIVDAGSNLQLHFVGQIRLADGLYRLALATRENGFFDPLSAEIHQKLGDLDGCPLPDCDAEEELKCTIASRLGFASDSAETS
jgi:hypothetical protein